MNRNESVQKLYALEKKIAAYDHAMGLISYDAVTGAPKGTAANRGETLGVLGEESYRMLTCDETREILDTLLENEEALDEKTRRIARLRAKEMEETRKIPMNEYLAFQKLANEADAVWHEAKENSDYASFEPYLCRLVETVRRFAGYVRPDMPAYEYLLDKFEPELTQKDCDAFFSALRASILPILARVSRAKPIDERPLEVTFPTWKQRALSDKVMAIMGLDRAHVGIAETEHPFTTNFTKYDVRITTHYHVNNFASGLFSTVHEGGHALYEANIGDEFAYTRLGTGVSMAVHESQSRFYENIIARSLPFARLIAPTLKELCPELAAYSDEALYRAFNAAKPSLIRTEADELTYCLHIMVRYELEKRLISGELSTKDLPGEWNRRYQEYLGVSATCDREGVLQDSHWASGSFGYFPSYALGSAYGAQLKAGMDETIRVDADVEAGDFSRINGWLKARIWRFGSLKTPKALMEAAFGAPFDPAYYTEYLKRKYEALYPEA